MYRQSRKRRRKNTAGKRRNALNWRIGEHPVVRINRTGRTADKALPRIRRKKAGSKAAAPKKSKTESKQNYAQSYNAAFDQAYNEGFNSGYAQGLQVGQGQPE